MKTKLNRREMLIYFLLFPFFYPRGFAEYLGAYKLFFTLWIYLSAFIVLFLFVKSLFEDRRRYRTHLICLAVYFVLMIGLTLLSQGTVTEGLQKLFVAPVLCLMCAYYLKGSDSLHFLRCLANILIALFVLNLTLFSPLFWSAYFSVDGHLLFLGHVQVAAQLGIVGIWVGFVLCLSRVGLRRRGRVLIALSLLTMLMSDTSASLIVLLVLLAGAIYVKLKPKYDLLLIRARWIVVIWLGLNAMLFILQQLLESRGYKLGPISVDLNGRMFIWKEIFGLLRGHWLQGYGVYGVKIKVFWHSWSGSEGMNYAHNQLLQLMLDGGILLLIAFILMLYAYMRQTDRVKNRKLRAFSNLCMMTFLIIMLTESVTEYYYFYVFLSLMGNLPEIVRAFEKKRCDLRSADHRRSEQG